VSRIFENKVALVTGAARGIGAATVRMFVENGAKVVLGDVLEEVQDVASDLGDSARSLVGSVADPEYGNSLVGLAEQEFGQLDFAFNNAGIGGDACDIEDLKIDDWKKVININLDGVFYGIKYQIPAMVRNGGGVIINTSSVLGLKPIPGSSLEYTAAKHGVIGLTRQVAVNYGGKGIRCNAICPVSSKLRWLRIRRTIGLSKERRTAGAGDPKT
jgi:NAD(P)-dependent dehydrogenase (short-subunit alcohol dehydrogenase family)